MSEERALYGADDCSETGYHMPLANKVIVVRKGVLPVEHPCQLFYCTGGFGANPNPNGRSVFAVSLSTGEHCRWFRGDVIGTLKPELLPDSARLYLSQIRPDGASAPAEAGFSGYCFLEDGKYSAGVPLKGAKEAVEFAQTQAPYQHRILVCDREDNAVLEMVNGELAYPTREEMEEFRQSGWEPEQTGGMTMT